MTNELLIERLAALIINTLNARRIVIVNIEMLHDKQDVYLYLCIESDKDSTTLVRIKGEYDVLKQIIAAERTLREANDYSPLEYETVDEH